MLLDLFTSSCALIDPLGGFYTPLGLKIRLDPDAMEEMFYVSGFIPDLETAFLDIQLWALLPRGMCSVAAMIAAIQTHSSLLILIISIVAFVVGFVFQHFGYSVFLKIIFTQFLGGWLIAIPASIIIAVNLTHLNFTAAAFTQLAIVVCTSFGVTDLLFFPITFFVGLLLTLTRIIVPGAMERAFISILNRQASNKKCTLDWSVYNRQRDANIRRRWAHLRVGGDSLKP